MPLDADQAVEQTQEEKDKAAEAEAAEGAAAFGAGFQNVRGGEPPAEEKPAPKVAVPTAEEVAAKEVADKAATEAAAKAAADAAEWEGVPPALRAKLEPLTKIPDRIRNIEGHIGGLKSALHTATEAAKAARAIGGAAPSAAQVAAAAADATGEKWAKAKEDYPDWAAAMDERIAGLPKGGPAVDVAAMEQRVQQQVAPLHEQIAQLQLERVHDKIEAKHEGWLETVQTPDFKAWLGSQPGDTKALAASESHRDAIKLLDGYTVHKQAAAKAAVAKEKNDKRLSGALTPTGTQQAPEMGISDDEAFAKGFKQVRGAVR